MLEKTYDFPRFFKQIFLFIEKSMQMEKDNGSCRKKKELIRLKTDWKKKPNRIVEFHGAKPDFGKWVSRNRLVEKIKVNQNKRQRINRCANSASTVNAIRKNRLHGRTMKGDTLENLNANFNRLKSTSRKSDENDRHSGVRFLFFFVRLSVSQT